MDESNYKKQDFLQQIYILDNHLVAIFNHDWSKCKSPDLFDITNVS